jgi:hypothetical protein
MKENQEAIEYFKTLAFEDLLKEAKREDGTPETNPFAIQLAILQFRDLGMMDAETADRLVKEGFAYFKK